MNIGPVLTKVTRGVMTAAEKLSPWDTPWQRVTRDIEHFGDVDTPAVMFGGVLEKQFMAEPVRRALENVGVNMSIVETGPLNLDSFASSMRRLDRVVQKTSSEAIAQGRSGQVSLVGHSKGGNVIAEYLAALEDKDLAKIRQVITLGSPLQGVELLDPKMSGIIAGGMPVPAFRDLIKPSRIGSHTYDELAGFMKRWRSLVPDARIISVVTTPDGRPSDGIVKHSWSLLPSTIEGVHNLKTYGGNHASVGGTVVGMHDASFRALAELLAGRDVKDAAAAAYADLS